MRATVVAVTFCAAAPGGAAAAARLQKGRCCPLGARLPCVRSADEHVPLVNKQHWLTDCGFKVSTRKCSDEHCLSSIMKEGCSIAAQRVAKVRGEGCIANGHHAAVRHQSNGTGAFAKTGFMRKRQWGSEGVVTHPTMSNDSLLSSLPATACPAPGAALAASPTADVAVVSGDARSSGSCEAAAAEAAAIAAAAGPAPAGAAVSPEVPTDGSAPATLAARFCAAATAIAAAPESRRCAFACLCASHDTHLIQR